MQLPTVYTLTWCKRAEQLYGTTLVFKTLRDGFPNAPLRVIDAASVPEFRDAIRSCATACRAQFSQLERRVELADFIEWSLHNQRTGAAVFVDPDVCFWERIEDWEFEGLAAGRFIPRHHCEFEHCPSEPRLHTSLLWVPDVAAMNAAIADVRRSHRYFRPFANVVVRLGDHWRYFDAGACLYSIFPNQMRHFDASQLDAYDHIFAGTYADSVLARLSPESAATYSAIHSTAKQDYRQLKGCWRRQEEYFQSRRITDDDNRRLLAEYKATIP
jgi:hypothetical protein